MSDNENTVAENDAAQETPKEEPELKASDGTENTAAPEKEEIKECNHPSNTTGHHQKGNDETCIYCGHKC